MHDQIICPHCKKNIPLTQALSHQLQEKYQLQFEEDKKKIVLGFRKRFIEEREKFQKAEEARIRERIEKEIELKIRDQENETGELKNQNRKLQEQLLETNKLIRQLRLENDQRQLELEKQLTIKQQKIRNEERKRIDEEYSLKILEKEKKLQDALKLVEDYKRKIEQGSQQLQGEVLELQIENMLKSEFPLDEINAVPKGVRGADIIQVVKNKHGKKCGSIIWESKRTKAWSDGWINKLKDDQRQVKADLAVIVSNVLPGDMKTFGLIEGVWIVSYEAILGLALALRNNLMDISSIKSSVVGKNEKMEILYNYLSGIEFKQRVEAIIEAFTFMQDDIEKEKRWFALKWAKQEKNIRKVIDNTLGMHGDLQSIMGKSLANIDGLNILPQEIEESESKTLFE